MSVYWRDLAACRTADDPDLWHPDGAVGRQTVAQIAAAKAVCGRCPVRVLCLEAAMAVEGGRARDGRHGIHGGLTGGERHALYQRRARQARRETAA